MADILTLRDIQRPMVQFMRAHKRCALFAGMGTGKSSATIYVLELMRLMGELDERNPVLVIGPARVARDTWSDEVAKWTQFSHIVVVSLSGTPAERLQKLKRRAHIYTVSYELLPWLVGYWLGQRPSKNGFGGEIERVERLR